MKVETLNRLLLTILFLLSVTRFSLAFESTAHSGRQPYDGTWESLRKMPVPAWFDDGKIGIFIHWGPYSAIGYRKGGGGYAEHVPKLLYADPDHYYPYMKRRWGANPPEFGYKDIIADFKAENWDPDEWANLFAEVGAKYVVLTAEHHDGWANWDSNLTPWNAVDKGPHRDLVGDLGKAVRKLGLKFAPSYHRERHSSFFTTKLYAVDTQPRPDIAEEILRVPEAASLYGPFGFSKAYIDDYVARWKEIQTKYQPDFLWLDDFPIYTRDGNRVRKGVAKPEIKYLDDQVRAMITDFMNDASRRGQKVYCNNKGGNRNWPEGVGCLEKDNLNLKEIGPKWQSCTTLGSSFGYLEAEENPKHRGRKSTKAVIREMIEVVSRNGNFLINIGPKADGTIPVWQVERLRAMGEWLKLNGDAIYGTRHWKVNHQDDGQISFTTKGKTLYAIALERPVGQITIEATQGWKDGAVKSVRLIGAVDPVIWEVTSEGLRITPPTNLGESKYAWSFEIATDREQHPPRVALGNDSADTTVVSEFQPADSHNVPPMPTVDTIPTSSAVDSAARPPNFVVIFADDLGYGDLSCFGSQDIRTPRLDAMAAEGIKLSSFYAQPICGPSRAALMTGCYPMRVAERGNTKQVHPILHGKEITIAEILKTKDYATACFGKWDLARHSQDNFFVDLFPTSQGFDYFFGTPTSNDRVVNLYRGKELIEPKASMATLTRRYTDEAIEFMQQHKEQPFFVYIPHTMPHTKLDASPQFKGKSKRGLYGDVIEEIDHNVGRVLDTIREMGLAERTYVIFTSDNGPWLVKNKDFADGHRPRDHGGSAGPLRSGKVSTFEGGVRVPCVVWGPGRVPAGKTCNSIASTLDVLPTLAALAGADLPSDRVIDGEDIQHLFHGDFDKADPEKAFYYYLRVHLQAVRQGKWKLHLPRCEEPEGTAPFSRNMHIAPRDRIGFDTPFLIDLDRDLGETTNVADEHPDVTKRLLALAEAMRADLGDYDRVGRNMRFFDLEGPRPSVPPVPEQRKRERKKSKPIK